MTDATMTREEFEKFYDKLPEYCEVPTNDDGGGELIEVHKTRLTVGDVDRMARHEQRKIDQLRLESELNQLLIGEALRRGCQPDQTEQADPEPERRVGPVRRVAQRALQDAPTPEHHRQPDGGAAAPAGSGTPVTVGTSGQLMDGGSAGDAGSKAKKPKK